MKKVLIIGRTLNGNSGVPNCLATFLQNLPEQGFRYDLLLFEDVGKDFEYRLAKISSRINVLPPLIQLGKYSNEYVEKLQSEGKQDVLRVRNKLRELNKTLGIDHDRNWEILKTILPADFYVGYDIGLAYDYLSPMKFLIDFVHAKKKAVILHAEDAFDTMSNALIRKVTDNIDCFVSVSNGVKTVISKKYALKAETFFTLYNFYDNEEIRQKANAIIEGMPTYGSELKLFICGHVFERKGFGILLKALKILDEKGYDFVCYAAGDLDRQDSVLYKGSQTYINLSRDLGLLNKRIFFLGHIGNPYPYFNLCDIYLQPSISEGFTTAVVEAQILGKPCVVTDYSAACEQIQDGVTGFICKKDPEDFAEKIEMLILDENLRKKMRKNLERFESYENSASIVRLFDSLLAEENAL